MTTIRHRRWATTTILATTIAILGAMAGAKEVGRKAKPFCLRCGTTCDLEPICVCTPGTKKKPRVEYDVDSEPICLAGCASRPWQGRRGDPVRCTACGPGPCDCPGWVRNRKLLRKETVDEDVCVVERSVAYLCGPCSGRAGSGCCGNAADPPATSWWTRLTSWWR